MTLRISKAGCLMARLIPTSPDDCPWCQNWCDTHPDTAPPRNQLRPQPLLNCYLKGTGLLVALSPHSGVGWDGQSLGIISSNCVKVRQVKHGFPTHISR